MELVAKDASRLTGGALRARVLPAIHAAVLAGAFMIYRILRVEHGSVGRNVLVGRANAPDAGRAGLPVLSGAGYDGQFYYRLAVNPFQLDGLTRGIRIDSPIRLQRIGYPAVTWLLSGGQPGFVPAALVLVNLACVAALALIGANLAVSHGRAPAWGLAFCAFPGFVATISRDLTELLAASFVLAALLAHRRDRPVLAGLASSAAVLTRETALILAAAVLLVRLAEDRRRRLRRSDLAWLLPVAAYVAWQGTVRVATGQLPAVAEQDNVAVPFRAAAAAVTAALGNANVEHGAFAFTALALLALCGLVVTTARSGPREPVVAFAISVALTMSLSSQVWNGDPAELRTFMDVHLFGVAVLLAAPRRYLRAYAALLVAPFVLMLVQFGTAA